MDVELLAKMVGELVLDHDCVGLPGIGTFVAEEVPASFSDRGFTVNPPYRRLSFHSGRPEDDLLAKFYAVRNSVDIDAAKAIVTQYLSEFKEVLKDRKSISLPGLGRLRATKENNFFFVPDQDLDIFPDGFGLQPVSLRFHQAATDSDAFHAALPVFAPETLSSVSPEPAAETTSAEPIPEQESAASEPTAEPEAAPVPEPAPAPKPRRRFRWWIPLVVLIALAAIALAVFMILVQVAPDFIDSILYTPEELRIVNY